MLSNKNHQAKIWFIFFTVMLDMMGIGVIIPVWPNIIKRFISDPATSSEYFGYFASLYAVMQFLFSPLLGKLSDRFGRRPILLLSIFIAAIDYTVMAYAPTLTILFLGRALAGASGANQTIAMAYIADISKPEESAANFGKIGAAFGLGFILGPAIGGMLGEFGDKAPFLMAALLNLINFGFGYFVLPESLPPEKRNLFKMRELNPFLSIQKAFTKKNLVILFLVHFCFQLSGLTHPSIWALYTSFRYSWTSSQIGLSLAMVGILSALVQGGLTQIIIVKLGTKRTLFYGFLGTSFGFILFGFASAGWMLYVTLFATAIFMVCRPALQSYITSFGEEHSIGELQGVLVSITSLAAILNPLIVTHLFALFTRGEEYNVPGAPYFFAALISFIGTVLLWLNDKQQKDHQNA